MRAISLKEFQKNNPEKPSGKNIDEKSLEDIEIQEKKIDEIIKNIERYKKELRSLELKKYLYGIFLGLYDTRLIDQQKKYLRAKIIQQENFLNSLEKNAIELQSVKTQLLTKSFVDQTKEEKRANNSEILLK